MAFQNHSYWYIVRRQVALSKNTATVRKLLNMHTRFGETLFMRFRDRNARIKLRNVYFSKRKFLHIVWISFAALLLILALNRSVQSFSRMEIFYIITCHNKIWCVVIHFIKKYDSIYKITFSMTIYDFINGLSINT